MRHHGLTLIASVFLIAALWLGRAFVVPLLLAGLGAFVLAPVVSVFERRLRFPRALATAAALLLAFAFIAGTATLLVSQVAEVVATLPKYEKNFKSKLRGVQDVQKKIAEASNNVEEIEADLESMAKEGAEPDDGDKAASAGEGKAPKPVPVEVVAPSAPPVQRLLDRFGSPLLGLLLPAIIIVIFVPFLLMARGQLRERALQLLSRERIYLTRRAIDEATGRVSDFLLATIFVNLAYGVPLGLALWAVGMPNPLLWGLAGTVLRFIPYIGPWIAALMPLAVSVAVFESWTPTLIVLGIIVTLEFLTSNFLEPWIYGRRTGLSALAVLVAALFWSWLWGPVGLFLAVPLTLCAAVIGRYVPPLAWLHILLSADDQPPPHTRLYQSLLILDWEGAERRVCETRDDLGTLQLVDHELLPTLRCAEAEHEAGAVDDTRLSLMLGEFERLLPMAVGLDRSQATIDWNADLAARAAADASPVDRAHARLVTALDMAERYARKTPDGTRLAPVEVCRQAAHAPPQGVEQADSVAPGGVAARWQREPLMRSSEEAGQPDPVVDSLASLRLLRATARQEQAASGTPLATGP